MKCVICDSRETHIIDSRRTNNDTQVRRKRECKECGVKWNTYEMSDDDIKEMKVLYNKILSKLHV